MTNKVPIVSRDNAVWGAALNAERRRVNE